MHSRTLLAAFAVTLLASRGQAQPATYTVSIRATGILPGEQHPFMLGDAMSLDRQKLTVGVNDTPVAFPTRLADGQEFNVVPTFETKYGPRGCALKDNYGRINGANVVITATCGAPPPTQHSVSVRVKALGTGEAITVLLRDQVTVNGTSTFPEVGRLSVSTAGTIVTFPHTVGWKKNFYVSVAPGFPRICNPGETGGPIQSDMLVTFDCGTPAAAPTITRDVSQLITRPIRQRPGARIPGGTTTPQPATPQTGTVTIAGTFVGPVGSRVVLQLNGLGDLTATIPPLGTQTDQYNSVDFAFTDKRPAGSSNTVSIKSSPAGQVCRVYDGAIAPAGSRVRIGCEIAVDHVSRSTSGTVRGTFFESKEVAIGGSDVPVGTTSQGYGEARFVTFMSSAAGIAGATGKHRQIFWRDRMVGETRLVSAGVGGAEGDADSFAPSISADGLSIAFESYATNLVAGDANRVRDVFIWNAQRPETLRRVSVAAGGADANGESYEPSVSGDGTVVAFTSTASNLAPAVEGTTTANVFRRDLASNSTTLISRGTKGKAVGGSRPAISEDGSRIAFHAFPDNLVSGDANGLWDIFVFDKSTGEVTRVSRTSAGGERNQGQESASRIVSPAISGDGRFVAYSTTATNVVSGDANGMQDVFVVNVESGAVTRASVSSTGAEGNGNSPIEQGEKLTLSFDGTWVAFTSNATNLGAPASNVILHNNVTGETRAVSTQQGAYVSAPSLSRSAASIAFGGSTPLDPRATSSGMFVRFLGIANAFLWLP